MKVNRLRIEPHLVMPDPKHENFGSKDGIILWQVWVDDALLTRKAYPFEKTDERIDMNVDPNMPIWGENNVYAQVRMLGDYVIWTDLNLDDYYSHRIVAPKSTFCVFELDTYSQICDSAMQQTNPQKIIENARQNFELPRIQSEEIKILIEEFFPRHVDEVVIYRQPHDRYDTTGMMICLRVQKAIAESKGFKLCNVPAKTIELKLGLDMPEFIETLWHVGRCEDGFAVYFEEYPYFPAWLYSENLSKVFEQEDFVKEL